ETVRELLHDAGDWCLAERRRLVGSMTLPCRSYWPAVNRATECSSGWESLATYDLARRSPESGASRTPSRRRDRTSRTPGLHRLGIFLVRLQLHEQVA